MLCDLQFAIRSLRRAPVLAATSVLTLAVGTGLATGVFAVAYGVLLRPLPFAEPGRVAHISIRTIVEGLPASGRDSGVALDEFRDWERRLRAFDAVAASGNGQFTLRGAGEPRSVRGTLVTERFFDVVGARASGGGTPPVLDPAALVLGSKLGGQLGSAALRDGVTLGTSAFRVAAVMPADFTWPNDENELWVRADAVPGVTFFNARDQRRFNMVGRLAPGVTVAQARDDAQRVLREIDATLTKVRYRREADVRLVRDEIRAASAPTIVPFAAGAVLVLLIACANVSGLLAGRALARQREFAIRGAIGGRVSDVVRASLAESAVIAISGWALGMWFAYLFVRAFSTLAAGAVANLAAVRIDGPVILASLALAALVALLSGGVPALRAAHSDPAALLKETSERAGGGGRRARGALIVLQVAMSVVLLVAAGLLTRTVLRVIANERGFVADHVLTERLMLTQTVSFAATERAPFVNRIVAETAALPGVVAAGIGSDLPPAAPQITMTIRVVSENHDDTFQLGYVAATPGFLEAIGARLMKGRVFEARDRSAEVPPAVITESAARMMFQVREPVGREWPAPLPGPDGRRVKPRVIGVVKDIRFGGLDRDPQPILFAPWEKIAPGIAQLVVRTSGRPADIAPAVRRIVQAADPTIPIAQPRTLDELVNASIADRRLRVTLSAAFAGLALVLASVALWGLVAQGVLERRHEIAVRLAMGATGMGAVRLMLRGAGVLTAIGVLIGAAAAAAAARSLRHLLHGVSPFDPVSFAAACAVVAAVSLLACYIPARRAAAISPIDLLRS